MGNYIELRQKPNRRMGTPTPGGIMLQIFFQSGHADLARSKHKIQELSAATPVAGLRWLRAKICRANPNTPASTPAACRAATKSQIRTPRGARRESTRPYHFCESSFLRCRGQ